MFSLADEHTFFSNIFCAITKCKDGLTSHLVLSVFEGIAVVQDHYQVWMIPSLKSVFPSLKSVLYNMH